MCVCVCVKEKSGPTLHKRLQLCCKLLLTLKQHVEQATEVKLNSNNIISNSILISDKNAHEGQSFQTLSDIRLPK